MAAPSKAQLLNEVYTLLKKRYKLEPRSERLTVLEAVVYGICHEGTTREQAEQALSRFRDQFFDWNEVRVSSIEEIRDTLAGQPDSEERANRLRRFLRQLFEKTYGFALDGLSKKPLKESIKSLQEYEAMGGDYVLATVIQQALGGHAMPVDEPILRGLRRLGVIDEGADAASVRSLLERAVPKNRGVEFVDLMEELTHDTCVAGPPDCFRCELKKICPTGQARLTSEKAAAKVAAKDAAKASKAPLAAPLPPPPPPPPAKSGPTKATTARATPAPQAAVPPTPPKNVAPTKSAPAKSNSSKPATPESAPQLKKTAAPPNEKSGKPPKGRSTR
ncbi:MAG: putative endoIII-related endonuclease [Planctomycetota bacterium]|nr:putative endoIII-related endonuclease [Planctomycetota bacterium]